MILLTHGIRMDQCATFADCNASFQQNIRGTGEFVTYCSFVLVFLPSLCMAQVILHLPHSSPSCYTQIVNAPTTPLHPVSLGCCFVRAITQAVSLLRVAVQANAVAWVGPDMTR